MVRIVALCFLLGIIIGLICLQMYLSKRNNKWLGLILPFLCVTYSLIVVFGFAMFSTTGNVKEIKTIEDEQGNVIEITETELAGKSRENLGDMLPGLIITLITTNIPTAVFLFIYLGAREERKKNILVDKMKIQDL